MKDKKSNKKEQTPKTKRIPVCEENNLIKNKKVRENTGLSDKARIIMG